MQQNESKSRELLLLLCDAIHAAEDRAEAERDLNSEGENFLELLVMREDRVKVEVRKENPRHNEPHIHVTHTDRIDVSLSIKSFDVLAGEIDCTSLKHLLKVLRPRQEKLLAIWRALNVDEDHLTAEKLIDSF
jgi:hypothetical protein